MAYRREIINEGRSVQLPATKPRVKPNRGEVPHIVVVGGGVAGIILATRLGRLLGAAVEPASASSTEAGSTSGSRCCTPSLPAPGTSTSSRCNS